MALQNSFSFRTFYQFKNELIQYKSGSIKDTTHHSTYNALCWFPMWETLSVRTIFMANTNLVYQLNWLEHHSIIAEVRVYIPASPIFFKLKLYCLKNRQECVDYKRREFLNLITHDYKFFVCHDFKISDIDKLILALIFRFGVIIWSKTFFFMNY